MLGPVRAQEERGLESTMEGFLEEAVLELSADLRPREGEPQPRQGHQVCSCAGLGAGGLQRMQRVRVSTGHCRELESQGSPGVCEQGAQGTGFRWNQQRLTESVCRRPWEGAF